MEDLLKVIGKGLALTGVICVAGITFFETTKKVGETIVDISDAGINTLSRVKNEVCSDTMYNKVRDSFRENDEFYKRVRASFEN